MAKYSDLLDQFTFYPVAAEMLGPFNETAYELVSNLGRCIARPSGDDREFFCSSIYMAVVQRFNSIMLHHSFWLLSTWISGLSSLMLFL